MSIPVLKNDELTILVTGGSGFLGSHLCEKLIKNGHNVLCMDNLYSSTKNNIKHLLYNDRFEFIRHDITFPFFAEVDQIYNLACPASPIHYQEDPIKTARTNFLGTYNALELALKNKAQILFTSTSEVYGDPEMHPQSESYKGNVNPNGIRSCYDEGKRIGETLCFDYQRIHNTEIRVARIFNTFGPRMLRNDGRVISNFIVQALQSDSLTIYGDGSQTRSFCYVDDMIDGFIKLMDSDYQNPVNIGNPKEFSILEIANLISSKIDKKLKFDFQTLPEDDPLQRKPIIEVARRKLNWEPSVEIEDGLEKKFDQWAEVFFAMLAKIAFQTHGKVDMCDTVREHSESYQKEQDFILEYITGHIEKVTEDNVFLRKSLVVNHFNQWCKEEGKGNKRSKGKEFLDSMNKMFGQMTKTQSGADGWRGIAFKVDESQEEDANAL